MTQHLVDDGMQYRKEIDVTSPHPMKIPKLMGVVVNLVNDNPSRLDPIKLSAYVYYLIMWIAPFRIHNGMLARLIANIIFSRYKVPLVIFKRDCSDVMFRDLRHFVNIVETFLFESIVMYFALLKERLHILKALKIQMDKKENMKRFTGLLRRDDELTDLK